jgi:UDP-N-acetylglucosamine 2-epimerase (non-hydrolysing)
MNKILVIFGTRPEAIKMAPVIKELRLSRTFDVKVCVTAQHRSMLDQVLSLFEIVPDFDLDLMSASQTLESISARIIESVSLILDKYKPNLVVVHGDTTTTAMVSLASFYKKIPVAHIEAGLRTRNIFSPWPEELNRRITALIASLHFAPTEMSRINLLEENINPSNVEVTGNTVIDALLEVSGRIGRDEKLLTPLMTNFSYLSENKKLLLVTGHRRENFGDGMDEICKALLHLSNRNDIEIVYAVHMNPNVKKPVEAALGNKSNIFLIPPQDYLSFIYLMKRSYVILTDSGGIQEEAPTLGKPVLVMRDTTERPEAIKAGTAQLIGAVHSNIISVVTELLENTELYENMSKKVNPYGDGEAAKKIVRKIKDYFSVSN